MEIAVALFTYNRSTHTKQVLDALSLNDRKPDKLFVFHDGKKNALDTEEWDRVEQIIRAVDFCDVEVVTSSENKGLANSIIGGLNYVFKDYEAAVVLEDDCVSHPQFLRYMTECLNLYRTEKRVWQIGASAWQMPIEPNGYDVYFNQRTSSWGWGTWKDRWQQYERDYLLVKKIMADENAKERLNTWGGNLPDMLEGNLTGRCDSWAVFWGLKVIEKDGVCVSPYRSLINNIGFDASGTHGVKSRIYWEHRPQDDMSAMKYPEQIQIQKSTEDAFRIMTHKTSVQEKNRCTQKLMLECLKQFHTAPVRIPGLGSGDIAIWGTGPMCDYIIDRLSSDYTIKGILLTNPRYDEYRGFPVYSIEEFECDVDAIIVIPFYEKENIEEYAGIKKKSYAMYGFDECVLYGDRKEHDRQIVS